MLRRRLRSKLFFVLFGLLAGFSVLSTIIFVTLERASAVDKVDRMRAAAAQVMTLAPAQRAAAAREAGFADFTWDDAPSALKPAADATLLELRGESGGARWRAVVDLDERGIARQRSGLFVLYLLINTLLVMMAAAFWLTRLVTRPVSRLATVMQGVAGPLLGFRPLNDEGRADEIGDLTRAFNELMLRIQTSEADNAKYVAKLEDAYRALEAAQERVILSEKLASMGRLSAGIAHEIGNPLAAVTGYLALLPRLGEGEAAERDEVLGRAAAELRRIDTIIRGLLDFARPRTQDAVTVAPGPLLAGIRDTLAGQTLFKSVVFMVDAPGDVPPVPTGGGRLEQVLVNLCINAADAMAGAGRITLAARAAGGGVELLVSDSGAGIRPEDLPHVFEPFFTTKAAGKGTGLGLAIAHEIVKALGGEISVGSQVGLGTTFRIVLPRG